MDHNLKKVEVAFRKYSEDGEALSKLGYRQAFVFVTGLEPSKEDLKVVREYLRASGVSDFRVELQDFERVMQLYIKQLSSQTTPEDQWAVFSGG